MLQSTALTRKPEMNIGMLHTDFIMNVGVFPKTPSESVVTDIIDKTEVRSQDHTILMCLF